MSMDTFLKAFYGLWRACGAVALAPVLQPLFNLSSGVTQDSFGHRTYPCALRPACLTTVYAYHDVIPAYSWHGGDDCAAPYVVTSIQLH